MFAVFNRFNPAYEEAARDLGASGYQTIRHVVLPIVAPSLIGVALFGFTLSYDELARTSQSVGALNTLPLELQAMQTNATTPVIYALGTLTTALSIAVISICLIDGAPATVAPRAPRLRCRQGRLGRASMRILVVNPNTTASMTEKIGAAARAAAAPQAPRSLRSIRAMARSRSRATTTARSACRACCSASDGARPKATTASSWPASTIRASAPVARSRPGRWSASARPR